MRLNDLFVTEARIADKILKDPKMAKMLVIAMRHDNTIPGNIRAQMGPRPDPQAIIQAWDEMLNSSLASTQYGDMAQGGRFDDWITKLYIDGAVNYEDFNGEGGDALGAWNALSVRGLLAPNEQDLNRIKSISKVQQIARKYRTELSRIKDAERIEKMKRDAKFITIYQDERYTVTVPVNYGACYIFNNAEGYQANFCTGSSRGEEWYGRYSPDGIIISVVDNQNQGTKEGKWQIHAATNQIVNADQDDRHNHRLNDERFAEQNPGLMSKIIAGIQSHAQEILDATGHEAGKEISELQKLAPLSIASGQQPAEPEEVPPEAAPEEEPTAEPQQQAPAENGPGTYLVTQLASGRSARIPGDSLEHVQQQVLARYPDSSLQDYSFQLQLPQGQQ
jgi:hypothetical protein